MIDIFRLVGAIILPLWAIAHAHNIFFFRLGLKSNILENMLYKNLMLLLIKIIRWAAGRARFSRFEQIRFHDRIDEERLETQAKPFIERN